MNVYEMTLTTKRTKRNLISFFVVTADRFLCPVDKIEEAPTIVCDSGEEEDGEFKVLAECFFFEFVFPGPPKVALLKILGRSSKTYLPTEDAFDDEEAAVLMLSDGLIPGWTYIESL